MIMIYMMTALIQAMRVQMEPSPRMMQTLGWIQASLIKNRVLLVRK